MDIYTEIEMIKKDLSMIKVSLYSVTKLLETVVAAPLPEQKKYLTAVEAATYLDVSLRTFHRYKVSLPFTKISGRIVYNVKDIDEYLIQKRTRVGQKINFKKIGATA
jgi:hypothetical protein